MFFELCRYQTVYGFLVVPYDHPYLVSAISLCGLDFLKSVEFLVVNAIEDESLLMMSRS